MKITKFLLFFLVCFSFLNLLIKSPAKAQSDLQRVFINEIMSAPSPVSNNEWIELFNNSGTEVNLQGWKIDTEIINEEVIIPNQGYLIIARNRNELLSLYPNLTNIVALSMSLNNSGDEVILSDGVNIIDRVEYSTTDQNKSLERKGPKDHELCVTLSENENNSIGVQNLNYSLPCWSEEDILPNYEISEVLVSKDNQDFASSVTNYGDTSIYLDFVTIEEILAELIHSIRYFKEDGTAIYNPVNLSNYVNKKIKLVVSLASGQVLEKESEPIFIYPDAKIIITELLPNPDSIINETEFIEIFNSGNSEANMTDWYFSEAQEGGVCESSSTNPSFNNLILMPQSYLIVSGSLGVTLNNDGDEIFLCNSLGEVEDTIVYPNAPKSKSYSRILDLSNLYISEFQYVDSKTPGSLNIFQNIGSAILEMNIKEARNQQDNTLVFTSGVVSVEKDVLGDNVLYIQDSTAGIKVNLSTNLNLQIKKGDLVKVIGQVSNSRNERRIKVENLEDAWIINSNQTINPATNPIGHIEDLEGRFVKIEGGILENFSSSFDVNSSLGKIRISVLDSTGIEIPEKKKGDFAIVSGIVSQYDDSYRILPRYQSDLEIIANIEVSSTTPKVNGASTKISTGGGSDGRTSSISTERENPEMKEAIEDQTSPSANIIKIESNVEDENKYSFAWVFMLVGALLAGTYLFICWKTIYSIELSEVPLYLSNNFEYFK